MKDVKIGQRVVFSSDEDTLVFGYHSLPKILAGKEGTIEEITYTPLEDKTIVVVRADETNSIFDGLNWAGEWGVQILPLNTNTSLALQEDAHHKCPICGKAGIDLVFNFYCTNSSCQNYRK